MTAGVGGCLCPIFVRAMRTTSHILKLTNRDINYASIALAKTFLVVVHSTWIWIFVGFWCDGLMGFADVLLKLLYSTDMLLAQESNRK